MADSEVHAVLDLLGMLFLDWRIGALVVVLGIASACDVRSHRIPNTLIAVGLLVAVLCSVALPRLPGQTALFPFAGFGVGLAIFLPLWLLRAMGAGDVKLMATVGAFVGPYTALHAALATMAIGGALAIGYVLMRGTGTRMFHNVVSLLHGGVIGVAGGGKAGLRIETQASAGKLPYAVSITLGTLSVLVLQQLGFI